MSEVREVTERSFESEVCAASEPVLVDFYTAWCPPCKEMAPVLDQLARERAGTLNVVKVNAGEEMELAARFGVTAVPTIVHLKSCREVARVSGSMPREMLLKSLQLA